MLKEQHVAIAELLHKVYNSKLAQFYFKDKY